MNNYFFNNDKDLNSELMKAIYIALEQKDNSEKMVKEAFNEKTKQFNYNIDFKINGEEYSFKDFILAFIGRLDMAIEREANQLLTEKVNKISYLLDEIEDKVGSLNLEIEKELEW